MGAAFEIGDAEPEMAEERGDAGDVDVLALMAGAGERQFLVGQVELVDGAGGDHGEGLHRLDGRARKHRAFDVAGGGDDVAPGIGDDEGAAMAVFDPVAADHFSEDGIGVVAHRKTASVLPVWDNRRPDESTDIGGRHVCMGPALEAGVENSRACS